jgi:hypothetical protein
MAGNTFQPHQTDEIQADFRFQPVAQAGLPVYQGTNKFIFQQRNFV